MSRSRSIRQGLVVALLISALACERAPASASVSDSAIAPTAGAPPFTPVGNVRQLMEGILEPAADVYWQSVGIVVDSAGTHSHYPRTAAEWIAVRNSALVVAEAGNLLMMGPRARDQEEWMRMSRAMIETATRAMKAAEMHDTTGVFNIGAEMYETCVSCHVRYYIPQLSTSSR